MKVWAILSHILYWKWAKFRLEKWAGLMIPKFCNCTLRSLISHVFVKLLTEIRPGDIEEPHFSLAVVTVFHSLFCFKVYLKRDRGGQLLLKAITDGHVMITQEKINPDFSIPEMLVYEGMEEVYKLTFNVLPLDMSQSFRLLNEI